MTGRTRISTRRIVAAAQSCRAPRRAGFTLIEVLLVLAVLLVAMAISYPSFNRLFREQQMSKAIELVQVKLAAAKLRAIEGEVNYHFRFEPDGDRFVVLPEPEIASPDSKAAPPQRWSFSGKLPRGLKFDLGDWGTTSGGGIPSAYFQNLEDSTGLAQATWSQPLIFFFDSTSSGGQVAVYDEYGSQITFSVRDVTAGVTVSPIVRRSK